MSVRKNIKYNTDTGNRPTGRELEQNGVNEENYFAFVIKRTEKLSAALYLVTSLIADIEPLKWKLRTESVSLVSDITASRNCSHSDKAGVLSRTTDIIPMIVALLDIAKVGGLISEMNANMLAREYNILLDFVREKTVIKSQTEEFIFRILEDKEQDIHKGHKGQYSVLYNNQHKDKHLTARHKQARGFKKTQYGTSPVIGKNYNTDMPHSGIVADRTHRKKIILDLVKKKKEITIKDVSAIISDCSEKTIQRELISLVKDNILKKEGDKRWSRYSLKDRA